jgi:indole-3-glycerol phosphate synthase
MKAAVKQLPPTKGFANALKSNGNSVALIAEVKKASPSKGIIREDFNPADIALAYERAGAKAISVLTDQQFFQGSGEYLADIRKAVQLPLLRKDFIIDELQIYEARLLGADAILLIAAILDQVQLRAYRELAEQLGMDALVEVHNLAEMDKAVNSGARLLGINNRDLQTFHVSLDTTAQLAQAVPSGCLLVSESGIFTSEDIDFVQRAGAGAVLVGESLMRQPNIGEAVQKLLNGRAVS